MSLSLTVATTAPITKIKKLQSAEAYFAEGMRIGSYHDIQGALECFNQAIKMNDRFEDAYVEKAATLRTLGDLRGAEVAARDALGINPKNLFALYNLWRAVDPENISLKTQEAMGYIKAAALKTSYDYIAKAYVCLLEGNTAQAIEIYKAAAARFPQDQFIHYDLGSRLEDAKHLAESEAEFGKAKELDKEFFAAHVGLIGVLADQGKYAEALTLDKKALKSDSHNPFIHNSMAMSLLHLSESELSTSNQKAATKHLAEALVHIETAIELAPNSILYHCNHGVILYALGYGAEAVAEFSEAYRLYTNHKDDPAQHLSPENLQYLESIFESEFGPELLEKMPALAIDDLTLVPLLKVTKKESTMDSKFNEKLAAKNLEATQKLSEKQALMDKAVGHFNSHKSAATPDTLPQEIEDITWRVSNLKKDLDDLGNVRAGREQISKDKIAEEYFQGFTKAVLKAYNIALTSERGSSETQGIPTMPPHSKAEFLPFSSAKASVVGWKMKDIARTEESALDIVYRVAVKVTLDPAMSARIHNKSVAAKSKSWEVKYIAKADELEEDTSSYKKEYKSPIQKLAHHDALFLVQSFEHSDINPYNPPAKTADDVVHLLLGSSLEVIDAF